MEINERFLQLTGKIEIDKDYDYGNDLKVVVTIVDIKGKDNHDGTINRIYYAKLFSEEE